MLQMQKVFDHRIPYFTKKPHENQVAPVLKFSKTECYKWFTIDSEV